MEGPTPVSALIHAATMVAAGVYLIARMMPLFELAPAVLLVVAIVGLVTFVLAGGLALVATDIKRVLAYSTVSHLGLMMLSLGALGVAAALFHLVAHGLSKALLFLGAGSVMHGTNGETDIGKMGGLRKRMPITAATLCNWGRVSRRRCASGRVLQQGTRCCWPSWTTGAPCSWRSLWPPWSSALCIWRGSRSSCSSVT